MVRICNIAFNESGYDNWFNDAAAFPLSDFQKWAVKGIVDGDHVLVTAHTGSGKTLPAEFMIKYFTELADRDGRPRKRVIYASPIKALSNQKLHDMRLKYPTVSFGLLTGDCKDNPEADVLIMTTEILRNTLFNKKIAQQRDTQMPLSFEMDIDSDLGGVVFDEVHYINDADRGSVWEQSILLLPPQVQILMLSATIDSPERFAQWVEDEKRVKSEVAGTASKSVILAPTYERVVPLYHYMWMDIHQSVMKKLKGKPEEAIFKENIGKLISAKRGDIFEDKSHLAMKRMKDYLWDNRVRVHRPFVLNNLVSHLKTEKLLPAICFVFSRKHSELAAEEIEQCLFEEGETHSSTVEKECRNILMRKLSNYKEYLGLPEYVKMVKLLEKGVAVHHAGILPVLREMVEMLFDKGYIRLLFATETFAVGINMPTKTVIFTALDKFDGNGKRNLYPHEYTQMAGRAGRRGLDKKGIVIHCNNLFNMPSSSEYKQILCGKPQAITSKFKIDYGLLLSVIASGARDFDNLESFVNQSMVKREIDADLELRDADIERNTVSLGRAMLVVENITSSKDEISEYLEMKNQLQYEKQNKQKIMRRRLEQLENSNRTFIKDIEAMKHLEDIKIKASTKQQEREYVRSSLRNEIEIVSGILQETGFIECKKDGLELSEKGRAASQIQETHPLVLADLLERTNYLADFSPRQIVALLSMFSNIRVSDEFKTINPNSSSSAVNDACASYCDDLVRYENLELSKQINTCGTQEYTFDIMSEMEGWCDDVTDEVSCKVAINALQQKGIFLGDFVKAVLKINNTATELEKVAEIRNDVSLQWKLLQIPGLTLKYVVTNQSLYI